MTNVTPEHPTGQAISAGSPSGPPYASKCYTPRCIPITDARAWFLSVLPPVTRAGADKTDNRVMPRLQGIDERYVAVNVGRGLKALILDVDHTDVNRWAAAGLPPPTWLAVNPLTGHYHIVWVLERSVLMDTHPTKAMRFFQAIEEHYRQAMGAERGLGCNMRTINPLHGQACVTWIGQTYSMHELAGCLPARETPAQASLPFRAAPAAERQYGGRNEYVYRRAFGLGCAFIGRGLTGLYAHVRNCVVRLNDFIGSPFEDRGPLEDGELDAIADSVCRGIEHPKQPLYCTRVSLAGVKAYRDPVEAQREAGRVTSRKRAARTGAEILRVARRLIERGVELCKALIARVVGCSVRTVYRHWSTVTNALPYKQKDGSDQQGRPASVHVPDPRTVKALELGRAALNWVGIPDPWWMTAAAQRAEDARGPDDPGRMLDEPMSECLRHDAECPKSAGADVAVNPMQERNSMIPLESLRAVSTIVTHDNCPDGYASAMILHDALPSARVLFVRHGSVEHREIPATPGMLFCDFSPPADRAQEFRDVDAIVLDHHRTARELVESFRLHVFADEATEPGVSGAVLAWSQVWWPIAHERSYLTAADEAPTIDRFATIAGVRDTWQTSSPLWLESCAQAEALRFWPKETLLLTPPERWAELMAIGPVLIAKARERDKRTIEGAHRFDSPHGRVVCFQGLETSDIAEALGADADIVAG